VVFVGDQASLQVDGDVCASDNAASTSAALQATGSFAYVAAGGSVTVAAAADVQVDGPKPDVFIEAQQAFLQAGALSCLNSSTANSWQPGAYSMTGDLCACSSAFQQMSPASRTCNTCTRLGWNASLCACEVRAHL
jgi:hypothetical protein